jgi:hypothetical protein
MSPPRIRIIRKSPGRGNGALAYERDNMDAMSGSSKTPKCLVIFAALLLSGCVSPQKVEMARADYATFNQQRQQRAIQERCVDGGAMPGTTASLACRMGLDAPPSITPR